MLILLIMFKTIIILLKLVNQFTYLGSSISSLERDIKRDIDMAWTGIDRLMTIWKSNLSDRIKLESFQAVAV